MNDTSKDVMVKFGGKPFRCECGCNVFRWISDTALRCNSCSAIWKSVEYGYSSPNQIRNDSAFQSSQIEKKTKTMLPTYIEFSKEKSDRSVDVLDKGVVIVDVNKDGTIIGVEILAGHYLVIGPHYREIVNRLEKAASSREFKTDDMIAGYNMAMDDFKKIVNDAFNCNSE